MGKTPEQKAARKAAKYTAKAYAKADRAAHRAALNEGIRQRRELKARSSDGFTFHDDGTVEYTGFFGKQLPRATVLDVAYEDGRRAKGGRTAWALATGGANLLLTSSSTGSVVIVIATDQWVERKTGGQNVSFTKLYGLALQAKARAQR